MRTKQEKRLSQENLGKMTEEARKSLIDRKARDYSSMNFGIVEIENIRRNRESYEVVFSCDVGCGRYAYLGYIT